MSCQEEILSRYGALPVVPELYRRWYGEGEKSLPVKVGDVLAEGGLVVFDDEKVIGLFGFDQVAGSILLGVEGVGGHHGTLEGQRVE